MVKLNERCVLISVRHSAPGQTREDKKLADEVGFNRQVNKAVAILYPNGIVKPPVNIAGQITALVDEYSVGGFRRGERLLPVTAKMELLPKVEKLKAEFWKAVDIAKEKFDAEVAYAQSKGNGSFNRDNYPVDKEAFAAKFKIAVEWLPVPDESHIIFDMAQDEIAEIRESTARQLVEVQEAARVEVWMRLITPVRDLVAKLADYEKKKQAGERTAMHDSVITNIRDIVKLVPALNITGDPTLQELADEVRTTCAGYSADSLKENTLVRRKVSDQAKNILAKLEAQKPKEKE